MMIEVSPGAAHEDERHAGLDEPPREQRFLADAVAAVGVAKTRVLPFEVEGAEGLAGGDHLDGKLGISVEVVHRLAATRIRRRIASKRCTERLAIREAVDGHALGQRELTGKLRCP